MKEKTSPGTPMAALAAGLPPADRGNLKKRPAAQERLPKKGKKAIAVSGSEDDEAANAGRLCGNCGK